MKKSKIAHVGLTIAAVATIISMIAFLLLPAFA